MCSLVFCSVAGVAEGLEAARMLTDVGFLSCMAPQVDLQVLQTGKCLRAALKHAFVRFFSGVDPHVDEQLVPSVEGFVASDAASPETCKLLPFPLVNVHLLDMPHQLFLAAVAGAAVDPVT